MGQGAKIAVNVFLGFLPDLAIAWAVSRLTDSGTPGFWYTLLALQVLYFLLWLKTVGWSWVIFWVFGKEQMARAIEKYLSENKFPKPDEYVFDLEDYLSSIVADESKSPELRAKAAYELGTLNGYRVTQRYHLLWKFSSASRLALKRYRLFAKDEVHEEPKTASDEIELGMKRKELDFIAWLADIGFRRYISQEGAHAQKQPPYSEAERICSILEAFERKIVPNFFTESEEDKEHRFTTAENRTHFMWRAYGKL
jgi:hypothetical protein